MGHPDAGMACARERRGVNDRRYVVEPDVWHRIVTLPGCAVGIDCEGYVEGHHILTQQQLRRRGLEGVLWDVRNGIGLCEKHHRRHHSRRAPVARNVLPECAFEFAADHQLGWLIERYYPALEEAA